MILIAESGSTKCDWVLTKKTGNEVLRTRTKGLNPAILKKKQLKNIILKNKDLNNFKNKITSIYFYGAGCNTKKNNNKITHTLKTIFNSATSIVEEDIMAAVYATNSTNSVVCILGTGSNTCYYNGNSIKTKTPALGYMLMDEGSGNYFGKKLLVSYYYNKMPKEIAISFETKFNLNEEEVLKNLYQSSTPNKYLANFAPFLFENQENTFIKEILKKGIQKFIENHILQYSKELENCTIHFVGSIAYHSKYYISKELAKYNLKATNFIRRPIDNLINYILKVENKI